MATPIQFYKQLSPYERAKITAVVSMVFDFSTGMLKFAMGIATFVFTLCAGGLNSFFCGLTKRIYFNGMRSSMGDESRECGYYLAMGATFTVSSLFYALYMFRYSIKAAVGTPGPVTVIIVCAIAAFELALSFGGLVRARREGDLLMEGLKFVSISAAFAAVSTAVNTVGAMLGGYNSATGRLGAMLGSAGVVIGFFMVIKGVLLRRKYSKRKRVRVIER